MNRSEFRDLLEILLRGGGVIMPLVEVYVDESSTHKGSLAMSVAGYIFQKKKADYFQGAWSAYLSKVGLSHFRMTDCVHLTGPFKGWQKEDAEQVERKLIELIHKNADHGFAFAFNQDDYNREVEHDWLGHAYPFALRAVLSIVRNWAGRDGFNGRVAYLFEAGHEHQGQANAILQEIFAIPALRDDQRYKSHTFLAKPDAAPLQAADLLAWLSADYVKKSVAGNTKVRADFQALRRPHDVIIHWKEDALKDINAEIAEDLRVTLARHL